MVTSALILSLLVQDMTLVPAYRGGPSAALPDRSAAAAAAAVVPGVLLHGSGHFAAGDRPTAWRLLGAEVVGLGADGRGFRRHLAATGASRRTVEPFIWTAVAGGGLFSTSWLADLYGVWAPPGGTGVSLRVDPVLEARLGTRYVADPTLAGAGLAGAALDLRAGRWRVSPSAWVAADSVRNDRFEAAVAFRIVGPRAGANAPLVADGSFIDLVAGGDPPPLR